MLTLYRKMLRLYPAEYRAEFGEEMAAVFCELRDENAKKRAVSRAGFWVRETAGLVSGALAERLRSLGAEAALAFPRGRFTVRNGFRFPKATAILMMIILAGVVVAIRKGEVIATSLPDISQPVTPIHPAHSYLLPGVLEGFVFFYAAGLIGWAIVYALRRSGTHRLDQIAGEK
jgi:hypothetical protein